LDVLETLVSVEPPTGSGAAISRSAVRACRGSLAIIKADDRFPLHPAFWKEALFV